MKFLLFLAFLLGGPARANGYDQPALAPESSGGAAVPRAGVYLGGSFFFANAFKVSGADTGARAFFGEAYFPEIRMGYRFGQWFPLLGYTPFGNRSGEGNKRRGVVRLQMPYVFLPAANDGWEWKAGPGLMFHRIYGPGGGTELRNGGQAKVYYTPSGTSTTRLFYVTGGAAYINENWRYDIDVLVTGLLSTRRAFSFSLGAGYVF